MSKKSIILTLSGLLFISGAIYFSSPKKNSEVATPKSPAQVSQTKKSEQPIIPPETQVLTKEPAKSASSDEIIDYLVDGLASDEAKATEAVLNTTATPSSDVSISTNF